MSSKIQEVLERCAGIDIHKKTAVVCIMIGFAKKMKKEIRTFGTMTDDLRNMAQWLAENKISDCVIESTGPYWIPVFNILDSEFKCNVTLANPYQVKNVPNRKSDVKDAEWLCKLLKNGFISKSFIPPENIRQLREFVRLRKTYLDVLTAAKNRLIKAFETKNIKLSTVLTNVFSVAGFKVIRSIAVGEHAPENLIKYFEHKNILASKDSITKALTGTLKEGDKKLIALLLRHIDETIALINDLDKEIDALMVQYKIESDLLKTVPGISDKVANVIIAEAGTNIKVFPSSQHFASWIGLVPRIDESAGKRKNTSISGGNRHIRNSFVAAAWAAVKSKKTYWQAEFQRLRPRLGAKKAIVAIARKLAECVYSIFSKREEYHERGANSINERLKKDRVKYYKKKLRELGLNIQLAEPADKIATDNC